MDVAAWPALPWARSPIACCATAWPRCCSCAPSGTPCTLLQVLDLVARLAPGVAREVTLLQVIERAGQGPEAERYLETAARRLPQETLTCDSRVEVGDPSERILDVAGPNKLVVMVTRGRTGLLRWALGSVADRVAHGSPAGLLLLRARTGTPQR